METIIIIPARYASSRFPGKPLEPIAGTSLIERVWKIASTAAGKDNVYIATDDSKIETAAKEFTDNVVMTSEECKNGSERVFETLKIKDLKPDLVINFQGDAVLTPPWIIEDLISTSTKNPEFDCYTPAVQIDNQEYENFQKLREHGSSSGTFVTFDKDFRALYFSNAVIPFYRKAESQKQAYRHVGIYAYKYKSLEKYLSLETSQLESVEQLEQLRMLENGMSIRIVPVDLRGRTLASVDMPEDIQVAEEIIQREGELCA